MQDFIEDKAEQEFLFNNESLISSCDNAIKPRTSLIAWDQFSTFGYHGKTDHTTVGNIHFGGSGGITLVDSIQCNNGYVNNKADDVNSYNDNGDLNRKPNRQRKPDDSTSRKPYLPPCKVCGETATGFHYGANTCEACKGFFRRSKRKPEVNYKCRCTPEQQEAWKQGPRKGGCQSCRYQKCLDIGMSQNAIKLGRYSYTHKTRNIKQAKYHEAINSCKTEVHTFAENSPSFSAPSSLPQLYSEPGCLEDDDVSSSNDLRIRHCDNFPTTNSASQSIDPYLNFGISRQEIDMSVRTLTEAHISTFQPGNVPKEVIRRKHTEYLESYKVKLNHKTEPDINIQRQQVSNLFNMFEDKIVKAVTFAKKIPGFRELTLDDQASLMKASRVEIILFGAYKYLLTHLDTERQVITTPWGEELHLDEINKLFPVNIVFQRYKYAKRLDELRLSIQELSVVQAIVTVASDRCILEQPDKVDAVQQKLIVCLEHLLHIRPGGRGTLLYKIFNLITDLREHTEMEGEMSKKMLSEWPTLSKDNFHLLKELTT